MDNYDPNIQFGTHTIRVTLQEWKYKGHIAFLMGGNCKGADVIDSGLGFCEFDGEDDIAKYTENDCKFAYDEENDLYSCTLKAENGDELIDDEMSSEDVKDKIVAIEIINYEKEAEE